MAKVWFITWTSKGFDVTSAAPAAYGPELGRPPATRKRSASAHSGSRPARTRQPRRITNKELSRI